MSTTQLCGTIVICYYGWFPDSYFENLLLIIIPYTYFNFMNCNTDLTISSFCQIVHSLNHSFVINKEQLVNIVLCKTLCRNATL